MGQRRNRFTFSCTVDDAGANYTADQFEFFLTCQRELSRRRNINPRQHHALSPRDILRLAKELGYTKQ